MPQVKSLLAFENSVRLVADGLQSIKIERLKAEAQTFGWVAVRAHAMEWFDSLPARAFERHSFIPMSLRLRPRKKSNIGFAFIKSEFLHTPSPLIHQWALQHRLFVSFRRIIYPSLKFCSLLAGDVFAETYDHFGDQDSYDNSYDNYDNDFAFQSDERATVSRVWLWRMHFLKVF
jgi:hypothetical protein